MRAEMSLSTWSRVMPPDMFTTNGLRGNLRACVCVRARVCWDHTRWVVEKANTSGTRLKRALPVCPLTSLELTSHGFTSNLPPFALTACSMRNRVIGVIGTYSPSRPAS